MSATLAERPSVRTVHGYTDHLLRLTRWHAGARRRSVHRVLKRGALVELGSVVQVDSSLFMVYPAAPDLSPFRAASFIGGARELDHRLEVETLILYTVKARGASLDSTDPRPADVDDIEMED